MTAIKAYVFDLECDGFWDEVTTIHSLVLKDLTTGKVFSCCDDGDPFYSIADGLSMLANADRLIGHNIIQFDIPIIRKVSGIDLRGISTRDTLVMSRLFYPERRIYDTKSNLPKKLWGSHSLEAWGYRLGILKGDYGKSGDDWSEWSMEMQEYCEQDVAVTETLWKEKFLKRQNKTNNLSIKIEHLFAQAIQKQIEFGFPFNEKEAQLLLTELTQKKADINLKLQEMFPPVTDTEIFIPKRDNKTKGYKAGVPFEKKKTIRFNPASRKQIGERLTAKGWKPEEFTDTGQAKVNEAVLMNVDVSGAAEICEYLTLDKRIGQLANGSNAWIRLVKDDGRIHGGVNTCGAVTGRCTHNNPNMAQVPSVGSPYGPECRALFGPPDGWVEVGVDASGLELRCLAHYLHRFDGGHYAKELLEGDIHTANQMAAGLETRNQAKTFIYAFLYGAGAEKIGSIVVPTASKEVQQKEGAKLRAKFLQAVPALARLQEDVQEMLKEYNNHIVAIDGRRIPIRSEHAALNTLLQSAGAIVMKQATVNLFDVMENQKKMPHGILWAQMAHVHDEFQLCTAPKNAKSLAAIGIDAIKQAGVDLGFKIPLDGEAKIGNNWSECH